MAAKLGDRQIQAGPAARLAGAADPRLLQARRDHHAMMSALAQSAPAFPSAAQLAERWLAAQMLSNHLCAEAAELIVAAAFAPDQALPVPGEPPLSSHDNHPLLLLIARNLGLRMGPAYPNIWG
jgi:hypothetical protein